MSIIRALQNIYGRLYGILVFATCIFFAFAGIAWFGRSLFWNKEFNTAAFVLASVFIAQVFFHMKLVNVIAGVIVLFFSLFLFMQVATNKELLGGLYISGILFSVTSIIGSGILNFSFLIAFKHSGTL